MIVSGDRGPRKNHVDLIRRIEVDDLVVGNDGGVDHREDLTGIGIIGEDLGRIAKSGIIEGRIVDMENGLRGRAIKLRSWRNWVSFLCLRFFPVNHVLYIIQYVILIFIII